MTRSATALEERLSSLSNRNSRQKTGRDLERKQRANCERRSGGGNTLFSDTRLERRAGFRWRFNTVVATHPELSLFMLK